MAARRSRLGRIVIVLLLIIAATLLAARAGIHLLNRPAARAWVARELARRATAAVAQPVRIGDVEFLLYPARLALRRVEIGPAGSPIAKVALAEVVLGEIRVAEREVVLDRLRIEGVWVDAALPSFGGEARRPWLHVVVRHLDVKDVEISRLELRKGLVLQAHDMEARWSGSSSQMISAAVVHVGAFHLGIPGAQPVSGTLAAWGGVTPGGWEVRRLRGSGDGWMVDVQGSSSRGGLEARGRVRVDLAQLDRLFGIGAGLAGTVEATAHAVVKGREFRITASVASARAEVVGFHFTNLTGDGQVTQDGIEAAVTRAIFAGGEIEGSYKLGSFAPPWNHKAALRGEHVQIAGFLHELGVDAAGLAGQCAVTADVTWDDHQIKEGDGTAVVTLRPGEGDVPVAGRLVVRLPGDGTLGFATTDTTLAGGRVRWGGSLELGTWIPNWSIQGESVQVSVIARLLKGWVGTDVFPPELRGEAALDIRLRGPFKNLTVVGDVAAAPVAFGTVDADGLEASFRAGQGVLKVEKGELAIGTGHVDCAGELRYGKAGELDFRLSGAGLPLARVVGWGGVNGPFAGRVAFTGTLGGTIDAPSGETQLHFADVAIAGVPLGEGAGRARISNGVVHLDGLHVGSFSAGVEVDLNRREARVDAQLTGFGLEGISPPLARFAGGVLDVEVHGAFPFNAPAGRLALQSARGCRGEAVITRDEVRVELDRPGAWRLAGTMRRADQEYRGHFDFGVTSWKQVAHDLIAADVPVEGVLEGDADLVLAPKRPAHVAGMIHKLVVDVEGERGELKEPTRFEIEGSALRLADTTLVGPRSSLSFRAARDANGSLSGRVSGQLHAALLGLIWREARASGRVELVGEFSGTSQAPRFEGLANVTGGTLQFPGIPAPLTAVKGVAEFVPQGLKLVDMRFAMAGAEGSCDGRIIWSPRFELDLEIKVDHARWPLVTGFVPELTGVVRLVGPLDNLSASGTLVLERSVYRRPIDLQKLILEQLIGPQRVATSSGAPVALNIDVSIPGTLEVYTEMARLAARGQVRVVGTSAQPGLLGRLEVLPGGELELSGQRYELDRGTVTFSSSERIAPFLDILAHTTVQTFEISVGLVGTLDRLTPTFTSNPPLAEMDIVSLLSLGRRADEASQAQAGSLASSFLSEQLTGAVTKRARTLLDVDQLRVDPLAVTQTGNPTARLTVVKQLSRDWSVTVSTNLASNREEVVVSRWRLSPGLFLDAARDADGSYSLEVKWQHRY